VRIVIICAVLAVAAAGCGGSGASDGDRPAAAAAPPDLRALVLVSPDATGWSWAVAPRTRTASAPIRLDPTKPSHGIEQELYDTYRDAGFSASATSDWVQGASKVSSFANLMADADGARSALAAERVFQRRWYTDFEHTAFDEVGASGLGDGAWAMRGGRVGASFAEINWAEGPLTLSVYVSCGPCPQDADVLEAARRWALTIDAKARSRA
jgi:hypothetical protein